MRSIRNRTSPYSVIFRQLACSLLGLSLAFACFDPTAGGQDGLVAWWPFDDAEASIARDVVATIDDRVVGPPLRVSGVVKSALKCDGFTSRVVRAAATAPPLPDGFTIESWVAVRAYPWGWCPIVSQRRDQQAGYFLGIDAEGHLGLQLAVDGKWTTCTSQTTIPLLKWVHVTGCFDPQSGLRLFIDGTLDARLPVHGRLTPANNTDLLLGRNHGPQPVMFETKQLPVYFSFDGLLDEVKIYDRSLRADEIRRAYESVQPAAPPSIAHYRLPSGPPGQGRFGAYYSSLKYAPAWDAMWRGTGPDVVVRFDKAPFRFVCWRGISYAPCWVTEKGHWFTNEFMERGVGRGERGCTESMSDKRAKFSHVKILENNDARTVVYWRSSPVDIYYQQPFVDEETGWGDWSEEYHTIYPDGVAVRKVIMFSSDFKAWHEWCQSIEPLHPGQRPEDVLDSQQIISVANMQGTTKIYGWEGGKKSYAYPTFPGANMQITFLRSRFNPFLILDDRPGRNERGGDGPAITRVAGDGWSNYSAFPWRNHWPVTQVPIIGRYAVAADRPSHTYTSTQNSAAYATTHHSMTKIMLCGMTARDNAVQLLPLARSWLQPPKLHFTSNAFHNDGYDPTQRAYVLTCTSGGNPSTLECLLAADAHSPVVNPCIVIKNWGDREVELTINGTRVERGNRLRIGHHRTMERSDLVIWLEEECTKPLALTLTPTGSIPP